VEVTAGLNETETLSLLKSAADRAKAEALQALSSMLKNPVGGSDLY